MTRQNIHNELTRLTCERPELFRPIPLYADAKKQHPTGSVDDWRGKANEKHRITINDNKEPLVNVSSLSPPLFCTNDYVAKLENSAYISGGQLTGAVLSQYVRKSVADMLLAAQQQLPYGYRIIVFDAWRSLDTQMAAYNLCFDSLVEKLVAESHISDDQAAHLPLEVSELISKETQNYISLPSPLPANANPSEEQIREGKLIPSPHNTGGSVDVGLVRIDDTHLTTLKELETSLSNETNLIIRAYLNFRLAAVYRQHATLLNFGTDFDFAGQQSALTYFETNQSTSLEPQLWRRLLYAIMTTAGFQAYSEEWWHFNYGNQMAERTKWLTNGTKGTAIYGGTELTTEQRAFEQLHELAFDQLVEAANTPASNLILDQQLIDAGGTRQLFLRLSEEIGDPRTTRSLGDPHDMKYRGVLPEKLIASINAAMSSST